MGRVNTVGTSPGTLLGHVQGCLRFEGLGVAIEAEEKVRVAAEQHAIFSFEKRVSDLIFSGSKDRATAIRWIHEAEDTQGDDEYLCYTLGLPYMYFRKVA